MELSSGEEEDTCIRVFSSIPVMMMVITNDLWHLERNEALDSAGVES